MRKPSRVERETIITYNEAEVTARIFTYNRRLQKYLEKSGHHPIAGKTEGAGEFLVNKAMISIRTPKKLSPEAREKCREVLARNRTLRSKTQDIT